MRYYLGPWLWSTAPVPHYAAPMLTRGTIDFATITEQSTPGSARRIGFFATDAVLPSEYTLVGEGHARELKSSTAMQDAFRSQLGYRPQGETLAELLYDTLTMGSDPDGNQSVKTLMPTVRGWLEVHLGGHSPICNARFQWGKPCSRGRQPTAKIKALLQRQFRESWERTNGNDHCRRVLDYTCQKFKVDDWHEFVPQNLRAHVKGRLPHATTINESFNQADSSTLGPDLTWTEVSGTWATTNQRIGKSGTSGVVQFCRAESALSSDDCYASAQRTATLAGLYGGPCVRIPASPSTDMTFYTLWSDGTSYLVKQVAGTQTNMITGTRAVALEEYRIEADGSTISGYFAGSGTPNVTTTDTAITGNLYCGIDQYESDNESFDDFEAADLAADAGIRYTQLERSTRGLVRGVYGGSI